jgi:hypothetical protein
MMALLPERTGVGSPIRARNLDSLRHPRRGLDSQKVLQGVKWAQCFLVVMLLQTPTLETDQTDSKSRKPTLQQNSIQECND